MIMGERAGPTHNLIKFGGFSHPAGKLTLPHRSKSPTPHSKIRKMHMGPKNTCVLKQMWDSTTCNGCIMIYITFLGWWINSTLLCCFCIFSYFQDGRLQEKPSSLAKFSTIQFHQSLCHLSFCKDSSKKWRWLGCF